MNRTVAIGMCFALVQVLACTPYKRSYDPNSKFASGDSTGRVGVAVPGTNGKTGNQPLGPATDQATSFSLAATKFTGSEDKMEAVVKFAGLESGRVKLATDGTLASFSLDGLPVNQADSLVIELYEGENLRFIAKRAATQLASGTANQIVIDDCSILKAPWDGKANDGSCSWSIEEAVNN